MRKCVVVDLDDTIWKGVAGEEGATLDGPRLALQRVLLDLRNRGVILAINSENNLSDVDGLLRNGPLTWEHFVAWRINWQTKTSNMRELADKLNIGLDSMVFLDNSTFERAWMRHDLPEVLTVDLPEDVDSWARLVANLPELQPGVLTEEDQHRTEMYAQERARKELAKSLSQDDFIDDLCLEVRVSHATLEDLSRLGQLVRKVNQFNLCANRRDDSGLKELLPQIYVARVVDRFGDYGLVGVAIVIGDRLDTFLLSCRAMGRGVEYEFLRGVIDLLGLAILHAWFVPTPRNSPCADFLPKFGFVEKGGVWTWTKS